MEQIFFDNASTTRMKQETLGAMMPYFIEKYANPSSIHSMAKEPRAAVDNARATIAKILNAEPNEIYFTSGGTESDNWALISGARMNSKKGKHVIISSIEHHAIIETAEYLEKEGFEITRLKVDKDGLVDPGELRSAIRPDTTLISVMMANNEIGTIEPIAEIGKIAKENGIIFHTDAVQAVGHIPIDVRRMNIDLLSTSGHKFGGPKGVGFLFMRKGIKLPPFIHGGAQENGERAGTTNVPGIVGMGKALEISASNMKRNTEYLIKLRDHYIERVEKEIPFSKLNGHRTKRLPGNANFSFKFVEGESLLMLLNMNGICVSTGSACASGSLDPSHVLLGIGLPHEIAHGSVRVTLSEENTVEEIDHAVDVLKSSLERLRSMSPLYEDYLKNNE